MSVSALSRPFSSSINPNTFGTFSITILTQLGVDYALFLSVNHGLQDGDIVYIKGTNENYNGFWFVDRFDANNFTIFSFDVGSVSKEFNLYSTGTWYLCDRDGNKWNCVHLPIVYKLTNTLWPTNSADTVRTMSSVTDSNGYCNITASGDIKATGSAAALEFVKITGATDSSLNKVWQIITYSSDTSFVLNIPYSAANDTALTGASIQYYYNNYNVRVRVYGGLPDGHIFNSQRPYVEIAEIKLTPDGSNVCAFSVSDILKSQITTDNNTLLGTLPNNINNWTGFYIEYAEAYDVATAGVLVNTVGSYTSDKATFQGYAVNAELPFKNIYSGAMSEYVSGDSNQKFLTLFDEPVKFSGKYFDIGFISTFFQTFTNESLADFTNNSTGTAWTLSSTPSVTLADGASSQLLSASFSKGFKSGITYRVGVNINYTGASTTVLTASIEAAANTNVNFIQTFLNPGANVFTVDLTAAGNYNFLVFRTVDVAGAGGGSYGLNNYWIYPIDDTMYANIELRQGGLSSMVESFDEGVYRVQLEEPNCNATSMDVSLYKGEILPLDPPGAWIDITPWALKSFTKFTFVDASGPYTEPQSYTVISIANGDTVNVNSIIAELDSGSGFGGDTIFVTIFLTNSANVIISNVVSSDDIGSPGAISTFNAQLISTATDASARLHILPIIGNSGIGSVELDVTIPSLITITSSNAISETKTIKINCDCSMPNAEGGMVLSWLNYLGGYDHWFVTTERENQINILETAKTVDNIYPNWPNSYGEFARGITRQAYRKVKDRVKITTQLCTREELLGLEYIKTSPIVTITNSIYDTRIILIDEDSFTLYKQSDKQYTMTFYGEYTNYIPSQRR